MSWIASCVPWRDSIVFYNVLNSPAVYPEDVALFLKRQYCFLQCLEFPSCVPWRCSSVPYYMSWIAHLCTQKRQLCSLLCLELPGCVPWRDSSVLYYVLNCPAVYPEETAPFFTILLSTVLVYCLVVYPEEELCSLLLYVLNYPVVYLEETAPFFTPCFRTKCLIWLSNSFILSHYLCNSFSGHLCI